MKHDITYTTAMAEVDPTLNIHVYGDYFGDNWAPFTNMDFTLIPLKILICLVE